jgi:hypothetical protein
MIIVVALELAQHGGGVSLVDDEKAVEEFAADGAERSVPRWRLPAVRALAS